MNPTGAILIDARGLVRRFGHVVALRSVTLAVAAGEVVLLTGPNGAGKSTLLRCLAGLARPTAGTVGITNRPPRDGPPARSPIGFLSHQTLLYDDLTARENLRFAAALHGLDGVEQRVRDSLDAAGLAPRADTRAGVLSHGMRRRLAIARATIHRPGVLLLDEPFSGLDVVAADELRGRTARDAAAGMAVICVTHQPSDIWQLATRVVVLHRGDIVIDVPRPALLDPFLVAYREAVAA